MKNSVTGIFSKGIWRIAGLHHLLPMPCRKLALRRAIPDDVTAIAVWGRRPSAAAAVARARKAGLAVIRLEDGFIRSCGPAAHGHPPLSLVIDYDGIYYDASQPSTLENLIQDTAGNAALREAAQEAMRLIVEGDLAKYNHAPPFDGSPDARAVLVVDQTAGDMSVTFGNASAASFRLMLESALAENPDAEIWVKTHPDVVHGGKRGYLRDIRANTRLRLITEDASPQSLLRCVSRVYTVTSHFGFEALMAGKPVVCFGQPWYAGWGLTDDRHPAAATLAARRGDASLLTLFSAAYLRYARYLNPQTKQPGTLFDVLTWLALQRRHHLALRGTLWVPGLTLWKRSVVKPFLSTPRNRLRFTRRAPQADACVVWGTAGEARWQSTAQARGMPVWRMEDAFLRSVGLGSDLFAPLSLVLDKRGLYYDATRASDLEIALNRVHLTPAEEARAAALRRQIIESRVSKYNAGSAWRLPASAWGRRILLVPGQVSDDASLVGGTQGIRTIAALLRMVRARNPQAYIVFKPHPDVACGNRQGEPSARDALRWADCLATQADIVDVLEQVDEVHTLTSLAGFEALLRGKAVCCYGMPFYAGWGLTHDEYPCPRRTRRLTLNALIHTTLIDYPFYLHPTRKTPIAAEEAVALLSASPRRNVTQHRRRKTLTRLANKARNLFHALFYSR
ncbi:capsular polysaccharide biosynthesis protein [Cronobacter sakazakii]|uniref:capsular polysaccharide biosynthesis protein n=1 Tax=Cronobacter sakazakii TaxID=28141 RepID=UPI000CF11BA2|nr:capsular polysaccharide biosynthesis protein [Cronobacter sakazakii]EJQ2007446.1 capsular polysaccharide biosynthesis protein [Cronobacter sakazakii]EJQ2088157.1 capsular polysaccharide biosynthesis protein [Cronobacter sakazakii]EJR9310914.1 capsular polysaccharide biosynthesis protein [Cronobacter sakazakii]EJR9315540.1 capsular polysaccharide biosynthesis protein [Cronobacter sakazakii]EJR9319585.1 capsular polysaccharide biosynthesis protein [Cronobacter sakazakii]